MSGSISTSVSGTKQQVKESLDQYKGQFSSRDGENAVTVANRGLSNAAAAAIESFAASKRDGSIFSLTVSGSDSGTSVSLTISGSVTEPAAAATSQSSNAAQAPGAPSQTQNTASSSAPGQAGAQSTEPTGAQSGVQTGTGAQS